MATSIVLICSLLTITNAITLQRRDNKMQYQEIMSELETVARRGGLRGEFINYRNIDDPDPYTFVARLFERAEKEILLLDHRPSRTPERYGSKITLESIKRKNYYDILTSRVTCRRSDGHYLRYRRIIQLEDESAAALSNTVDDDHIFSEHCRAVLAIQNSDRQYPSAIKTSPVFFPKATITIIDAKIVIMEIAIEDANDSIRIEGDLVLVDEDGVLTRTLCQLFEYIDSQATLLRDLK